ncbi:MAG: tesB [Microbacteriaceae bacterium]|nr:tesB [Microbacteriaceae bacterium]
MTDFWAAMLPQLSEDLTFETTLVERVDGSPRTFGGNLSAIALTAAIRSTPGMLPHSLHSMFLRPATTRLPLTGTVRVIRDGRQFAQRRVELDQGGRRVFEATISLQGARADAQPSASGISPVTGSPSPEQSSGRQMPFSSASTADLFEQRLVTEQPLRFWARAINGLPDDPVAHYAAVASMTDIGLVRAASPGAAERNTDEYGQPLGVTLEHSLWFHLQPTATEWALLVAVGIESDRGRSLARGEMWSLDGRHVATYVQDVLAHPQPPVPATDTKE